MATFVASSSHFYYHSVTLNCGLRQFYGRVLFQELFINFKTNFFLLIFRSTFPTVYRTLFRSLNDNVKTHLTQIGRAHV